MCLDWVQKRYLLFWDSSWCTKSYKLYRGRFVELVSRVFWHNYGTETWAVKAEILKSLERAERRMVRWMCGVSLKDRKCSGDLCRLVVKAWQIEMVWTSERKSADDWVFSYRDMEVAGMKCVGRGRGRGRGRKTWEVCVKDDIKLFGLQPEWTIFRDMWRDSIWSKHLTHSLSWKKETVFKINDDDDDDDITHHVRHQIVRSHFDLHLISCHSISFQLLLSTDGARQIRHRCLVGQRFCLFAERSHVEQLQTSRRPWCFKTDGRWRPPSRKSVHLGAAQAAVRGPHVRWRAWWPERVCSGLRGQAPGWTTFAVRGGGGGGLSWTSVEGGELRQSEGQALTSCKWWVRLINRVFHSPFQNTKCIFILSSKQLCLFSRQADVTIWSVSGTRWLFFIYFLFIHALSHLNIASNR